MNCIVAADRNWGIGCDGKLLVSIPADLRMFRQETMGKVIVYGRKTLETFPMAKPLEKRINIILSRKADLEVKGAEVVHSVEELLELLKVYPTEDIYIIGGDSVYHQMIPYCDVCHVTRIDHAYQADTWFPDLDQDPAWHVTAESDEQTYFDIPYTFMKYERI